MEKTNLVVIGSGPSGYAAAIYAARDQLEPVLFAGIKSGGQLMFTTDVENYPGFPEGIKGPDLMMHMRAQAERFGTKIKDEYVTAVDFSSRPFKIWTSLPENTTPEIFETGSREEISSLIEKIKTGEHQLEAKSVIISTGAVSIMLGVPGEKKLLGKGVSTCAVCDAAFFKDKITYVVGGGDSAMEDAMALTKFSKSVTIIHRRDSFRASKIMQERILSHKKINVLWNSSVTKVQGENKVESITVLTKDSKTGKEETKDLPADGLFIAIGHKPVTDLFKDQITLDNHGYVVTRQSASKLGVEAAQAALSKKDLLEFPSMTSVEGVFGAGDVVDVRYKQAITAAGQGCSAALDSEKWLAKQA